MPTLIDSLVVRLGFDNQMAKQAPEATRNLRDVEGAADNTSDAFRRVGEAAAAFLALIGGTVAIKAFINDTIDANAALDRLSRNLGVSVSTISAWGNAVEETGGSASNLQSTMDSLSKAQTQFRLTGESSLVPYFSMLGVSIGAFGEQVRPVDQILLDLAGRFSHIDRTQANNIGRAMGIDQDTMNLLLRGRKEVELTIARQKEYNAVTKEQADAASQMQTSLAKTRQEFEAVGRTLLQDSAPGLERFFGLLQDVGVWLEKNIGFVKDFGIVLGTLGAGLAAIAVAASPITLTVAAVTALAAAIALLWDDYSVWKKGGESLIDWSKWEPAIEAAKAGIKGLGADIRETFQGIRNDYDATVKFLHGDFKGAAAALARNQALNDQPHNGAIQNFQRTLASTPAARPGQSDGFNPLTRSMARSEGFFKQGTAPQRNNNPGDITWGNFAKTHGATGHDGKFAIFPDVATGQAAQEALLESPAYRNLTVPQAISKWAPPSDHNPTGAYIASTMRDTGASSSETIAQLLSQYQPAGQTQTAGGSTVTNNIPNVNIYTHATDIEGIARDAAQALDYHLTAQANSGIPY